MTATQKYPMPTVSFHLTTSGGLRRLVEVFVVEWRRRAVVLADRDQRADVLQWCTRIGLTEGDQLYFIGTKEFEDAFSDEVWLKVLKAHFPPRDGGDDWSLAEVESLRAAQDGFGGALRALVCQRCRDHKIGKPDLGAALGLKVDNQDDVPAGLRACLDALRATTTRGE